VIVVEVDARSPVPPFEQLRAQLAAAVRSGRLAPGERLPTLRQLAADLGLAPNTVGRAYRELELAGLIVTRGRHGTVVADNEVAPPTAAEQRRGVHDAARRYLDEVARLGVSPAEARHAVERLATDT
jgi:DNA-binding transcriptional regulator YhcF (GntR family)